MPAMKRPAGARTTDPVKTRTKIVADAIGCIEDLSERVCDVLTETIAVTIGQQKATRHPFNERLVTMIGEVLDAEEKVLQKSVVDKQVIFDELTPNKGAREGALEEAKTHQAAKNEAFDQAKQAVAENAAKVKEAASEVANKKIDQEAGDEGLTAIEAKKASLAATSADSLTPLLSGAVTGEEKNMKIKAVVDAGKTYAFDASLMQAVVQVLEKEKSERTGFDATCTEQIQGAFASTIQGFDDELATGAPAKAERQVAVEAAEAAKEAAEATQAELVSSQVAAKEAKDSAAEATKTAKKNLADFMPELKDAGDALDEAKSYLEEFTTGALVAYNELKEWKEGDFVKAPVTHGYYETIDGLSCDRAIIDACRTAVAGQGDGRVSAEDAKQVFEKVADGGKETQKERWTLRFCMQEFKWTDAAHDWIVEELQKVPQEGAQGSPAKKARSEGSGYYEVVDGYKCDRAIIDTCRELVAGQGDGRVSRDDAEKVWAKAKDGNKVTDAEKWTVRFCLANFNWTRAGHDWIMEQMHAEMA